MKSYYRWHSMITVLIIMSSGQSIMDEPAVRIMSYNIRYDNPDDGPNVWVTRKDQVVNLIRFYQADLIGLQEVLHGQLTFLEEQLTDYARIGVGRSDGKQQGEFSPILYHRKRFTLLNHGTFWLSETPDQPSVGWDASLERIATWGKFLHQATGDTLFFLNTHFDHRGEQARQESARLLRKQITKWKAAYPVVVTGDFNSTPQSVPYQLLTEGSGLRDTRLVSESPPVGPQSTYSGFTVTDSLPGERIDYVFARASLRVLRYATVTSFSDGYFPSDHLPIIADLAW